MNAEDSNASSRNGRVAQYGWFREFQEIFLEIEAVPVNLLSVVADCVGVAQHDADDYER